MTSSVVASALGCSVRHSPLWAWCAITGEPYVRRAQAALGREVTDIGLDTGSVHTQRGHDLEPVVLRWAANLLGCEMEQPPFVAHPDGWAGDSADALFTDAKTGEVSVVEAKSVSPHEADAWGREMTAQIPHHYWVQCHWHLLHYPAVQTCWVPFIGGYDFGYRLYRVERDPDYERELWDGAHAWHTQYVVGQTPPPVTHQDTEYLTAKWPRDNAQSCEPTEAIAQAVELLLKWRARRDLAEARYGQAANLLRQQMREFAVTQCDRFKVSYRTSKEVAKIDWEGLARAKGVTEADIHKFTTTRSGARTLRVTGREDLKAKKIQ